MSLFHFALNDLFNWSVHYSTVYYLVGSDWHYIKLRTPFRRSGVIHNVLFFLREARNVKRAFDGDWTQLWDINNTSSWAQPYLVHRTSTTWLAKAHIYTVEVDNRSKKNLPSSCNRVSLLLYEIKPTDKWEQYDWAGRYVPDLRIWNQINQFFHIKKFQKWWSKRGLLIAKCRICGERC